MFNNVPRNKLALGCFAMTCLLGLFVLANDSPKENDNGKSKNGSDSPKQAADALEGTWQLKSFEISGDTTPGFDGFTYVFRDGKSSFRVDGQSKEEYTYRLDRSQSPAHIDLMQKTDKGEVLNRGIFRLDGETLHWCLTMRDGASRPTAFSTRKGDGLKSQVFIRLPDSTPAASSSNRGTGESARIAAGNAAKTPSDAAKPKPLTTPKRFNLTFLETPANTRSTVSDIIHDGTVLGEIGQNAEKRPCLWRNGQLVRLKEFDRPHATAFGINQSGILAGTHMIGEKGISYLLEDGKLLELTSQSQYPHRLTYAVNTRRQVVGLAFQPLNVVGSWLWEEGQIRTLPTLGGYCCEATAINEHGHVAGVSTLREYKPNHAFLWRDGKIQDLGTLGGPESKGLDLNDAGHVVGFSSTLNGTSNAFVWRDGKMQDLDTLPGGSSSVAWSINNTGMVTGSSSSAGGEQRAVFWQDGGIYDLNDLTSGVSGCTLAVARAVNDRGWIVGTARRGRELQAFLLEPVFDDTPPSAVVTNTGKPAAGEKPETAVAPTAVFDQRDKPFGHWVNDREYVNQFVTPLRIKLTGDWERAEPRTTPLHVGLRDGSRSLNLRMESSPKEVLNGFVLWAKADYGVAVHTLGLYLRTVPDGQPWAKTLDVEVRRLLTEVAQAAPLQLEPVVSRSVSWIDGRRCDVLDSDAFFANQALHERYYLIPGDKHLLVVEWSFSNATERMNLDALMREMFDLGPSLKAGQTPSEAEQQLHSLLNQKQAGVLGGQALREATQEVSKMQEERGIAVQHVQRVLDRPVPRGGFLGGGQATRFGNFATARESRRIADERAQAATKLQEKFNTALWSEVWKALSPTEQAEVRRYRPELVQDGLR